MSKRKEERFVTNFVFVVCTKADTGYPRYTTSKIRYTTPWHVLKQPRRLLQRMLLKLSIVFPSWQDGSLSLNFSDHKDYEPKMKVLDQFVKESGQSFCGMFPWYHLFQK